MKMYILKDREIKETKDPAEFEKFLEILKNRIIGQDTIGDSFVSTVFLGIDYNLSGRSTGPILFETMIFGGGYDGFQHRYTDLLYAEQGHALLVELLKKGEQK